MIPKETEIAPSATEAVLLVVDGPQLGVRYPLSVKPTVIGRDPDGDICLENDTQCSRQHARIFWLIAQFVIEDLDSTNGTYVNDSPIMVPTRLNHNDKITIGTTTFQMQLKEAQAGASPKEVPVAATIAAPVAPGRGGS